MFEYFFGTPISSILTLSILAFIFFIFKKLFKTGPRKVTPARFDKMAEHTAKSRRQALDMLQRKFDVQLVPGQEIVIESLSGAHTPLIKMHLDVQMTNPSEYVITIEEVRWELWVGPVVKTFMTTSHAKLKAKKEVANFVIQEAMSEQDFLKLVKMETKETPTGYLEGIAVCRTDFGRFEKKFMGFNLPYVLKGNIGGIVDGAQMEKAANVDSLTGLLQRKFIEESFQTIIDKVAQTKPVALIMFDIDFFKKFNDNYGHLIGDEILKTVSAKLKEVIGEKGLAVRYGGDEFCVILEGLDSEEAGALAKDLHERVGTECRLLVPQGELTIALSVGVAVLRHPASYLDLIKMADKALYESKRKGRNQVTIDHNGLL